MEVIEISHQKIPALVPSACCVGYFDGLHKGHQLQLMAFVQPVKIAYAAGARDKSRDLLMADLDDFHYQSPLFERNTLSWSRS